MTAAAGAPTPRAPGVPMPARAGDFYVYAVQFAGLAAGAAAQGSFQIDAGVDFSMEALSYASFVNGGAEPTESSQDVPMVTIQFTDGASGLPLQNIPVPINALFGRGSLYALMPRPKIFPGGGSVQVNIANFGTSVYQFLWLLFIGQRLYRA